MSTHPNIPFYCGTQRMDWKCFNCEFCTKRYDDDKGTWRCDLEKLIDESYMDDGSVSAETAKRMGVPEDVWAYNWRCPEFVEDAQERARAAEYVRARASAKQAYENRNRTMSPEMDAWVKAQEEKMVPATDNRGPWTLAYEEGFDAGS